jgi:hypothetical protein
MAAISNQVVTVQNDGNVGPRFPFTSLNGYTNMRTRDVSFDDSCFDESRFIGIKKSGQFVSIKLIDDDDCLFIVMKYNGKWGMPGKALLSNNELIINEAHKEFLSCGFKTNNLNLKVHDGPIWIYQPKYSNCSFDENIIDPKINKYTWVNPEEFNELVESGMVNARTRALLGTM